MPVREILKMGDPRLLSTARPVQDFGSPALQALVADMFDTMVAANGAGLAAPQIGVDLAVVIFGFDRACSILKENEAALHRLAAGLLEREILDREEIALILEGKPLPAEEEERARERRPAAGGTVQAPAEPAQVLAAEGTASPTESSDEKTDRTNGRRAGESTRVPEPAARYA